MQMLSQSQETFPTPSIDDSTRGVLQRKCECGQQTIAGGSCAACSYKGSSLQRTTRNSRPATQNSGNLPPVVHEVLRSAGQPLDAPTRAFFEPRFGHDLSGVRVHSDDSAAASALAVNARAYTVGRDVVFGSHQYSPETSHGRSILAHELAHVAQSSGSVSGTSSDLALGDSKSPQEREADLVAARVVDMDHTSVNRPAQSPTPVEPGRIQRVLIEAAGVGVGAAAASLAAVNDRDEVCMRFWVPGRGGRVSWSGIDQETLDRNVRLKSEDDLTLKKARAGDTDTLDAIYFGKNLQRRVLKVPDHCTVEVTNSLNNRICCCNLAGKAAAALIGRDTACRWGTAAEFRVENHWEPDGK